MSDPNGGYQAPRHGFDCVKVPHRGPGYLHEDDHDGPYDVDDCTYCGRCHRWIDDPPFRGKEG